MPSAAVVDGAADAIDFLPSPLDNPLIAAALAVTVVVFVIAIGVFLYLRRRPAGKFARLLRKRDDVAVLMHPNPDPDAMSCALAVSEIADNYDTEATMYYPGQIRHHENRAFEAVLDVEFKRIEHAEGIEQDDVVLVDHNKPRDFPNAETIDPIAVIDHHPGDGTGENFTDVRTDLGACATIFAEYFADLGWTLSDPDDEGVDPDAPNVLPSIISTGLLHGILADTKHLTDGCTDEDFEAVKFLRDGVDEGKLGRMENPDMDAESMEVKARAITDRNVKAAFAVSDVGTISNADAIPQAADELQRLEGINAVVVFGDKDGVIRLSGRSDDDRVHMGKTLKAVAADIPVAEAGGHARMGGGTISIEHMEGIGPSEGLTREELIDELFAAMNGEL
jgi:nanoRNase/pAp phosphatase (c-di-AMP/oligoRNAs hydrolase)